MLQKCLNSFSCIEALFGFEKINTVCHNLTCNVTGGIDHIVYEHLK